MRCDGDSLEHFSIRKCFAILIGVLIWSISCIGIASAQMMAPITNAQDQRWTFELSPYLWAAGLKGDVGVSNRLPAVDVDLSFNDILDSLDMAGMVAAEARRGKFGILVDFNYISLSADGETPGPLFSGAELDNEVILATLGMAYRVFSDERSAIDVTAGMRFWNVSFELDFRPGLLPGESRERSDSWVDPLLGLRGNINIGSGFFLSAAGDVGGFGVASDVTWQLTGLLGYQFDKSVVGFAGYRHLNVDYENDGFVWDVDLSGPMIGLTIRF